MALQTNKLAALVIIQIIRPGADRFPVELFLTAGFQQVIGILFGQNRRVMGCQMPQEGGIRRIQFKFNGIIIDFADGFNIGRKLQTVKIRIAAAVDIVIRVLFIHHAGKAEHHIIRIHFAGRFKPVSSLKIGITAQIKTVGRAVIQHCPAGGQFRDQAVGVRVNIQQAIVNLCRQRLDNQPAAGQLRVKCTDVAVHTIDKTGIADRRQRSGLSRDRFYRLVCLRGGCGGKA